MKVSTILKVAMMITLAEAIFSAYLHTFIAVFLSILAFAFFLNWYEGELIDELKEREQK